MRLAYHASDRDDAQAAKAELIERYGEVDLLDATC